MASEDNKVVLQYPGGEYEMDIKQSTEGDSGFDISKLRNETGLVTFDPGYTSTGSTESKITFINGEEGILRHRGYDIADLAENATFNDVVGSFTTGGYSGASGTNIALVAQTVNGAVVNPGETFSLNGYTGPRGPAQGYVESGIILNGRADTAVGGGISQFATTLYNASYFAGMTDVAHMPHSYYISR